MFEFCLCSIIVVVDIDCHGKGVFVKEKKSNSDRIYFVIFCWNFSRLALIGVFVFKFMRVV